MTDPANSRVQPSGASRPCIGALAPGMWERESWEEPLSQFARATGISVSVYGPDGRRCLGPILHHPLGALLEAAALFEPDGAAAHFERELVRETLARASPVRGEFAGGLEVRSRPATSNGDVHGAVVYGWVFARFPDPLMSERVARAAGIPTNRFWTAARQHLPVSTDKFAVYEGLLDTLSSAILGQLVAREALLEASRMKDEFLSMISHELRTPLTSVQLRLQSLMRSWPVEDARVRGILEAMGRGLNAQKRLIDELLDTSRILTGKLKLELRPVNLAQAVRETVETVTPMAQAKNVSLTAQVPEVTRDIVGDPERLQQLFWNLLSNAVKFTPPEGNVSIRLQESRHSFEITVRDTGQGIDPAALSMVFTRFYQGPSQVDRSQKGIGLGLSIARHIADLHGGAITAHSDGVDRGAMFVVRLPITAS